METMYIMHGKLSYLGAHMWHVSPLGGNISLTFLDYGGDGVCRFIEEEKPKTIIYDCSYKSQDSYATIRENSLGANKELLSIIQLTNDLKIRLVFISSSLVYGEGLWFTEKDKTCPFTSSAIGKVLAENKIRELCNDYIILRVAPIYGPKIELGDINLYSYVDTVIKNSTHDKDYIYAVMNQRVAPVYIDNVENVLSLFIDDSNPRKHVFNLGGPDMVNQVDMAVITLRKTGISGDIIPVSMYDVGIMDEPANNSVSCLSLYRKFSPHKRVSIIEGIEKITEVYRKKE